MFDEVNLVMSEETSCDMIFEKTDECVMKRCKVVPKSSNNARNQNVIYPSLTIPTITQSQSHDSLRQ